MDLRQKHWVIITVVVLITCFAVLAAYFLLGSTVVPKSGPEIATSTIPQVAAAPVTPLHITEHAKYYDIDLTYPSATPFQSSNPSADAAAVASMKASMQNIAAEFKKNGNFDTLTAEDIKMMGFGDGRKESLTSEYKTYTGDHTVSYVFSVYEDTFGAHPNLYFRTFTFDTTGGQEISLSTLLGSVNYLTALSVRARADLPAIIKKKSGYSADSDFLQDGTKPVAENFKTFYIQGKNLVLVFPPYQVGPYALGTVLDSIPLAQFSASLKPEFR